MNEPQELVKQTTELENIVAALVVSNDVELTMAGTILTTLAKLKKEITGTFKESKEAASKTHKTIIAAEKKHLEPVESMDDIVRMKVGMYMVARDAKLRKEQDDAKLKMATTLEAAGQSEVAMAVIDTKTHVAKAEVAGVSARPTFTYKIVDTKLIPVEYWTLNESLIGKIVRAKGKDANIPGIEVIEGVGLTVRA